MDLIFFKKSRPWHQKPFVTLEEVSYFFDQNSLLKVSRILIVKAADFDLFYLLMAILFPSYVSLDFLRRFILPMNLNWMFQSYFWIQVKNKSCSSNHKVISTGYCFWDRLRNLLHKFTWTVLSVHKLNKLGKFW